MRWWTFRREVDSPLLQPPLAAVSVMILLHLLEARDLVDTSDASMAFSLAVDRGLGEVLGYLITGAIIDGFVSFGAATDSTDCSTRAQASPPSPSPTTC